MSESQKTREFLSEPIGNKPVDHLPGVGKVLATRLRENNIEKASEILGQYMAYGQDEAKFSKWFMSKSGANSRQQQECVTALKQWTDQYIN